MPTIDEIHTTYSNFENYQSTRDALWEAIKLLRLQREALKLIQRSTNAAKLGKKAVMEGSIHTCNLAAKTALEGGE